MSKPISTKRVVTISFFIDLVDLVSNLIVALLTGSAVIFAEMVQGGIDAMGSFLLLVGYRRANRPRDARHPFGYTREVFFWALLSSMIMLFLGSGLSIYRGYQQLLYPEIIRFKWLAFFVLTISVITNGYALSLSIRKLRVPGVSIARAFTESSRQLVKTAFLRDMLGMLSAVFGFIAIALYDFFGFLVFDALGAILIGLLMATFALILISQAKNLITGQAVPRAIREKIFRSATKIPEIQSVNRLAAVYTGSEQILVDLDVELKDHLTTTQVEQVLDRIKDEIVKDVPEAQNVQIDLNSPTVREEVKIEKHLPTPGRY